MRKAIALTLIYVFVTSSLYPRSRSLGDLTSEAALKTGRAVVSISSLVKEKMREGFSLGSPFGNLKDDSFQKFFRDFFGELPAGENKRVVLGSGVIIDSAGHILTNIYAVSRRTDLKVNLPDGREYQAQVKGADRRSGLAVIKIEAENLPVANLGDSDNLRVGEWVMALGNPLGPYTNTPEPTVAVGVVSALHRYLPVLDRTDISYDDLIQTDAAINPGNSGGPLIDLDARVVGINTLIFGESRGYPGLGFAIPINKAKRILDKLLKGESITYGWLGVNIQNLNEDLRSYLRIKEREGVVVLKVYRNSPAEKSGFKEGDLILTFNDQPVAAARDLIQMVSSSRVGEIIPCRVVRSGKILTLDAEIGLLPESVEEVKDSKEPVREDAALQEKN